MKHFNRTAGLALLVIVALQGCYTNPSVSGSGSIEEFALSLNGKRYALDQTGLLRAEGIYRSRSGLLSTPLQIPAGLTFALAPAQEHCKRVGGVPSFAKLLASERGAQLPQRILCLRDGAPIWALEVQYVDLILSYNPSGQPADLEMTLRTQLLSPERSAARLQEEEAHAAALAQAQDKSDAARRERQAAADKENQQRTRERVAETRRIEALWSAKVATFQANLKVGDRFQWARPPGGGGPFVGMVARLEGAMAFVQFDNLTIGGQQTRYIPKVELEPFDGPTPNFRRTID